MDLVSFEWAGAFWGRLVTTSSVVRGIVAVGCRRYLYCSNQVMHEWDRRNIKLRFCLPTSSTRRNAQMECPLPERIETSVLIIASIVPAIDVFRLAADSRGLRASFPHTNHRRDVQKQGKVRVDSRPSLQDLLFRSMPSGRRWHAGRLAR